MMITHLSIAVVVSMMMTHLSLAVVVSMMMTHLIGKMTSTPLAIGDMLMKSRTSGTMLIMLQRYFNDR